MFRTAPRVAAVSEAGLWPAVLLLNNSQLRYSYVLLAVPQSQSTRDILPVMLREGEEQLQPVELADGDNNWFKPKGIGEKEVLGQGLTRTVAEDRGIDTTTATEHTE